MAELREVIAQVLDKQASGYRRRRALEALALLRDPEVAETLRALLQEPDKYFRREVVNLLLRRQSPEVTGLLQQALNDPDDVIRRDAALALGDLGEAACVSALQRLQQEPHYLVREAATRALEQLSRRGIGVPATAAPADTPPGAAEPAAAAEPTPASKAPAPAPSPAPAPEPVPAPVVAPRPPPAPRPVPRPAAHAATVPAPAAPPPPTALFPAVPGPSAQRRMATFFSDRLAQAQQRYAALLERQRALPDLELRLREVNAELGWHRADKEDELAECNQQLTAVDRRERELIVRQKAAASELLMAQAAHESFLFKLNRLFNGQAEVDHRKRCDSLQLQLQELAGKLKECERQQATLSAERAALLEPIATREASSATLTGEHQQALAAWGEADAAIDQLYASVLLGTPAAELDARLQRLAQQSPQPGFFTACVQAHAAALRQAEVAAPAVAAAREALTAANAAGATALADLGAIVAESFGAQTVPREVTVKLVGTVTFQGEGGMFGSSGPSGSARGSGSGKGEYEIDRLAWSPHPELVARVQVLGATATDAGRRAAELTIAEARQCAGSAAVGDWIRLLRGEVERDLAPGGR